MELLKIENLYKSFGGKAVIKGISMSVCKGEVVAVIGPSGEGKSTLLRCATLLESADSGGIYYNGMPAEDSRGVFGLVFQGFNLFPHWSVLKNVADAQMSVQKISREQAEENAMHLLSKMGLEDKKNAYPCTLSGGEKQRVSIARALALNPQIMFFDEPTSALDPKLTGDVLRIIRTLADEGMTMVIVTHEIEFARKVADRVVFVCGGKIAEQGTSSQVLDNPQNELTRAFLQNLEI